MSDQEKNSALMTAAEWGLYAAIDGQALSLAERLRCGKGEPLEWARPATFAKPYRPAHARQDVGPSASPAAGQPEPPVPLDAPVECVERPGVWYPSIADAAEGIAVHPRNLVKAIREGGACRRLHWRLSARRRRGHAA